MAVISYLLFLVAGAFKAESRIQFITDIVDPTALFAALTIFFIVRQLYRERHRVFVPTIELVLPYYFIVLIGLFSLIYTEAPVYGSVKFSKILFFNSLALFAPLYLIRNLRSLSTLFWGLTCFAFAMVTQVIGSGATSSEAGFVTAFGSTYLALARIIGAALLVNILYFIAGTTNTRHKIIGWASLPFMLYGLMISGGKGPVFAVLLSLGSIVALIGLRLFAASIQLRLVQGFEKKLLMAIVVASTLGLAFIFAYSDHFSNFFYRLDVLQSHGGDSALERIRRYEVSLDVITDYRYMFTGLGIGGFSTHYAGIDAMRGAYPHNIFLEFFTELGLGGFAAFVLLVFFATRRACRFTHSIEHGDKVAGYTILSLLMFMLFNASVTGDIPDNKLLFAVIGLTFCLDRKTFSSTH